MPILMTYWKTVWTSAMQDRDYRFHSHSPAELAAFKRRLMHLRLNASKPMPLGG